MPSDTQVDLTMILQCLELLTCSKYRCIQYLKKIDYKQYSIDQIKFEVLIIMHPFEQNHSAEENVQYMSVVSLVKKKSKRIHITGTLI